MEEIINEKDVIEFIEKKFLSGENNFRKKLKK